MYGAIIGDLVGSSSELSENNKEKDIYLILNKSNVTVHSLMSIAVADAQLRWNTKSGMDNLKELAVKCMKEWENKCPDLEYGGMYSEWQYQSCRNDAACIISSVGWLYDDIWTTRNVARAVAEAIHNRSEGIKGAESVASAVFLARTSHTKEQIRQYMIHEFGYNLPHITGNIQGDYSFISTCWEVAPAAIMAFLYSNCFEDAVRIAMSFAANNDNVTCITGSIAEAYYDVSDRLKKECQLRITDEMLFTLDYFEQRRIVEPNNNFEKSWIGFPDGLRDMLTAVFLDTGRYSVEDIITYLLEHKNDYKKTGVNVDISDVLNWINRFYSDCMFPLEFKEEAWKCNIEKHTTLLEHAECLLKELSVKYSYFDSGHKDIPEYQRKEDIDYNQINHYTEYQQNFDVFLCTLSWYAKRKHEFIYRLDRILAATEKNIEYLLSCENPDLLIKKELETDDNFYIGGMDYWQEPLAWVWHESVFGEYSREITDAYEKYCSFLERLDVIEPDTTTLSVLKRIAKRRLRSLYDSCYYLTCLDIENYEIRMKELQEKKTKYVELFNSLDNQE